jgi:hypothetical protein
MRTLFRIAVIALAALVGLAAQAAGQDEAGFVPLFDGKTLDGWVNVNCAPSTWSVRDGVIYCTGKPIGELRTKRMYQNFVIELQWRHLVPKGNAGVFVWSDALPAPGQPFIRAIEVQVLDGREGPDHTSDGDIFPIHGATMIPDNGRGGSRAFPTEKRSKPSPQWNDYRIVCVDGTIQLAVNGNVVTSGSQCSPRKGYICLESEESPVEFRNIRIRELPDTPIEPEHIAKADEGFISLYNGVDLTGWKVHDGLLGHWKPNDWRLEYDGGATGKEGKEKDLWTLDSFEDFTLVVDWRWPGRSERTTKRPVILPSGEHATEADGSPKEIDVPIADSGIYLRGSTKAQINIWQWPIGSGEIWGYRTDPSMPASVRAAATPKLKADNPVGKWNRFEITAQGQYVTIALNGKTVIDRCHLPGLPTEGPLALQHHGDPIEFANIFVKRLSGASPTSQSP